jgi:hypothetical protein
MCDTSSSRRGARRTAATTFAAGLLLATAACGASPSPAASPTATGRASAGVGLSTSSPAAAGTSGATSATAQELAFSRCIRAHGVPTWPDPNADGQEPPTVKDIAKADPQFPAASNACRYLLPDRGTNAQFQADTREYVRFAGCMRTHGVPNFPDPDIDPDGSPVFNLQHSGIDTQSPPVRTAALNCMAQLHLTRLPNYRV